MTEWIRAKGIFNSEVAWQGATMDAIEQLQREVDALKARDYPPSPTLESVQMYAADNARLRALLAEGAEAVRAWHGKTSWRWIAVESFGDKQRTDAGRIADWLDKVAGEPSSVLHADPEVRDLQEANGKLQEQLAASEAARKRLVGILSNAPTKAMLQAGCDAYNGMNAKPHAEYTYGEQLTVEWLAMAAVALQPGDTAVQP